MVPLALFNRCIRVTVFATGLMALPIPPAQAHVKWFAPYAVEAVPQPVGGTLTNPWFWMGIALVLIFFLATRLIEKSDAGEKILRGLDYASHPLWQRLDDLVRVIIGVFFVALFTIGGTYLTPELHTLSEWVPWVQLLIAALIFSRRTQPLAAAGIIMLWLLALRDYSIFHLFDYLALGVGVAGYLALEASAKPAWRRHRFEVLQWGIAITLMWSSLEKLAYPDWFYPLIEERPYLTFGMPRDIFIPMAGVAEFALGFGLVWTPLVRRLSASTLFIIFMTAVYPFGRIDLIGHALILATLLAIAADHTREIHFLPKIRQALAGVPAGLAIALAIFVTGYWGLHAAFYDIDGMASDMASHEQMMHSPDVPSKSAMMAMTTAAEANHVAMVRMDELMMQSMSYADPDAAFVLGMIPHHQGAIDMSEIVLKFGKDPQNQHFAREIIQAQQREIGEMRLWLRQHNIPQPP
jgi:hypothetical protein